jgi:hypothetical protein
MVSGLNKGAVPQCDLLCWWAIGISDDCVPHVYAHRQAQYSLNPQSHLLPCLASFPIPSNIPFNLSSLCSCAHFSFPITLSHLLISPSVKRHLSKTPFTALSPTFSPMDTSSCLLSPQVPVVMFMFEGQFVIYC